MMTMVLDISVPRILLTRMLGRISTGAYFGPTSPLRLADLPDPPLPAADWVRVRNRLCGICGSDLHQLFVDAGLDVATASVDPFTETQIQEGLETIMRDRTAIVIAHRLSTVKHADRTIVMDHGQIIEEGTHDQSMAQGGHYAELYNTYFRHQSLEYIESFAS